MKTVMGLGLCVVLFYSATSAAWNLEDHRELAKDALQDVSQEWSLNQSVEVHSLDSFLTKAAALRPQAASDFSELATFASFQNRSEFARYLQINPKIDIGTFASLRNPDASRALSPALSPLEILTLYATDPDDGRDQDIFLKDAEGHDIPAYKDQKWFGGVNGPNSQAFRHMEKPAFQLFSWKSTLGFPLRTLGEATRRAAIYFKLSQLAFSLSEDYWGWRFLAGGLHYLQDLHQPYHSGQITPTILKKSLRALKDWGWKQKGFIGTFAHIVANDHRFFESYVNHPGASEPLKQKALAAVHGKDFEETSDIPALATQVRDGSNRVFKDLSSYVAAIIDPSFEGPREFHSDGDFGKDNDQAANLLRKDAPDFTANNQHLFEIVADRFQSAGKVTRTYVHAAIQERQTKSSGDILKELDGLLAPQPH